MKRFNLLALAGLVLAGSNALAQNCQNYYQFKNGGVLEMTITNKKGKVTGKQILKPTNVHTAGGGLTATVNTQLVDDKGKELANSVYQARCTGKQVEIDMRLFLPSAGRSNPATTASAILTGDYLAYPAAMSVGSHLPDGSAQIAVDNSGLKTLTTIAIINRQVVAQEPVTTSAGTWSCLRITAHTKMTVGMGVLNLPALNVDTTEWYAPGFGIVKTESRYGKTELTAIQ